MIESTFGGLTFSNEGSPTFSIETLDGWYSGAPIRSRVEDRPSGDGAFGVVQVYRGARVITQTGLIMGGTLDDAVNDAWTAFAGLHSTGTPEEFAVTDPSGTRSVEATLAAAPEITPLVDGTARYVLQLVARDPVKYGPDVEYSTGLASAGGGLQYELGEPSAALYYGALGNLGRVDLANIGTAAIWPTIVVTGQLTDGFYVQCLDNGNIVRYDRIVPAGSTVTLDFRTGEVLIDGASDGSTYLTIDEWFSVPAGGTCTVQFNALGTSSGSPTMTVTLPEGGWW